MSWHRFTSRLARGAGEGPAVATIAGGSDYVDGVRIVPDLPDLNLGTSTRGASTLYSVFTHHDDPVYEVFGPDRG